jgi:hypothetical protein
MHDARYSIIGYQPEDHTILDTPKLPRHEFDDRPLGLLLHPVLAACLDTISTSLHPRPEAFMHQEPRALPWRMLSVGSCSLSAPRTCISGTLSLFALATNGCALVPQRRSRTSTRSRPTKLRPLRTSQAPWSRATLARRSRLRNGQQRVRSGKCLAMFLPSSHRANAALQHGYYDTRS